MIIDNITQHKESLDLGSLLVIASMLGTNEIIKTLVESGADTTPIMYIAQSDNLAMFKYLLEHGANLYAQNNNNNINNCSVKHYAYNAQSKERNVYNYIKTLQIKILQTKVKDLKNVNNGKYRLIQYHLRILMNDQQKSVN